VRQVSAEGVGDVRFLGFKYEPGNQLLKVQGAKHFSAYGGSGNYKVCRGRGPIMDFAGLENAVLVSLDRKQSGWETDCQPPEANDGFVRIGDEWMAKTEKRLGLVQIGVLPPTEDDCRCD
jgi:hypothetical protein